MDGSIRRSEKVDIWEQSEEGAALIGNIRMNLAEASYSRE